MTFILTAWSRFLPCVPFCPNALARTAEQNLLNAWALPENSKSLDWRKCSKRWIWNPHWKMAYWYYIFLSSPFRFKKMTQKNLWYPNIALLPNIGETHQCWRRFKECRRGLIAYGFLENAVNVKATDGHLLITTLLSQRTSILRSHWKDLLESFW